MAYQHGVRVSEQATSVTAPIEGTAGLQVVFGTAPINLAADPYAVTNVPVIAYSWSEAVSQLGYSTDSAYTLCQSMYASFKLFGVAPVIFVNVLDPKVHKKDNEASEVAVEALSATYEVKGVLLDTVKVQADEQELTADTDYVLSFDDDGNVVITLLATGTAAAAKTLSVSSTSIDPTAVKASDIIGASSGNTVKGLEVLSKVYPKFGMTPGLLLAPGWSQDPDVGIVLAAKCEEINGSFTCEAYVDIDSSADGCTVYTDVKAAKEAAGITSPHVMALWPCIQVGSQIFWASAIWGALTAYQDASNDDVPNLSPSNVLLGATGTVLADGTEILLDQVQANTLNAVGVSTAINVNGWRAWGNNSAAYPSTTDPKDRWFNCRRFFSWWGNSFILTYFQKVDNPMNQRLIESIVDSENIRGNSYVASGKCAAAYIEYSADENSVSDLLNGKLTFHQHLTPYPPAEDILNILEFDADALESALS
jgi:hypothetical protein